MKWIVLIFGLILTSCFSGKKEAEIPAQVNRADTMQIIRDFICGLWSMDSGNILMNEGYYFKPDGSVDFVAAEVTGEWKLITNDTIKISYAAFHRELSSVNRIDSLTIDRMVLRDSGGTRVFRKVPFGMNMEGTVLQGFAGTLDKGEEREYNFNIPSSKKIQLKLQSPNEELSFNVYDGNNLITSAPLREWTAIMIRGGMYRLVISNPKNGHSREEGKFDLKVISF